MVTQYALSAKQSQMPLGLIVFCLFLCYSLWWNERSVCVEEESCALAGFVQPPPETASP